MSFKEEVLESAFRKYQTSRSEGATEAEAAGEILVHSGNVEEICRYLEIEKTGDVPAGGPDGERDGGETCDSRNRVVGQDTFLKNWKRFRKNTYALAFELTGIIGSILSFFVMGRFFSLESLAAAAIDLLIFTIPFV